MANFKMCATLTFTVYFLMACIAPISPSSISSPKDAKTTTASNCGNDISEKRTPGVLKQCDPCPRGVECVPQIQCPAHVRMAPDERPQICGLSGGGHGFCCLTGQNHSAPSQNGWAFTLSPDLTLAIVEKARAKFAAMMHHPKEVVQYGQPAFSHNNMFHSSRGDFVKNLELSNTAMEQVIATQLYREHERIPVEEFELDKVFGDFSRTPLGHHCAKLPVCGNINTPHRSTDGSCNNPLPDRSLLGAAGQPMERLLPPAYEDGVWAPRSLSIDGSPLTNARRISQTMLPDINRPHPRNNLLTMQFGQFITHDVTLGISIALANGDNIQCCSADRSLILPPEQSHFACLPIPIDSNDEFYKTYNQRCMNFVRFALAPQRECKVGYGKQVSKVTHFLDGSPIYGSDQATQNGLRTFRGGRLQMLDDSGRDLLPLETDAVICRFNLGDACFRSGDTRTNQIISLVAVQTIFAREHNRVADILAQMNPHFSDEMLFQETRRIVVAEVQHIVYNEYLPFIVGAENMKRFGLHPKHHGYAKDYDIGVNPAVTAEFTSAAFRFGHSTVQGQFETPGSTMVIDIPDVMENNDKMLKRSFLDNLLHSLVSQPMQKADNSITHGLSRFLFRGNNPFGLDLAAINIQRGRDVGLRSYNDYLELMGNRRVKSFHEFKPEIGQRLSQVYKHPDDIDLFVGGLLEPPHGDGVVGQTFSEIIADQFSRLRRGDRYFYEYAPKVNPGAFTHVQLAEIRKVTMARILCDNADGFTFTESPPFAFMRSDLIGNHPIECDNNSGIPSMNLRLWKD